MKDRKWPLTISLYLNVILILALAAGYGYFRFQRGWQEMDASSWAAYAGALQAIADHDHGRIRYYRLVAKTAAYRDAKGRFTGEFEDGIEIWSWPWYPNLGGVSRVSTHEFVKVYNSRMKNFMKKRTTTRPAALPKSRVGLGRP